jgi:hypothetical protein
MRSILLLVLSIGMTGTLGGVIIGGCSNTGHKKSSTTEVSEVDDCPMCPGVQHAKADGTCPKCGMKVKG